MNLMSLVRGNDATNRVADRSALVSRYQQLRAVGRNLNNKLVKRLAKDVLQEGGRRLGILKNGTFVFDSEDETSVLMDYCIYDVRRSGRNCIEQYLADSPPDHESDEMVCLRAMQRATYSLFIVESVERGLGVTVRDLRSNETILVVDMGFGSTAQPGLVLATRLLRHDGFAITGGAALPIGILVNQEGHAITQKLAQSMGSDEQGYCDPAPLIRACLQRGCSSNIQYQEPTGKLVGQRRALASSAPVGRNSPCPCGSGKKFKQCCLKRA